MPHAPTAHLEPVPWRALSGAAVSALLLAACASVSPAASPSASITPALVAASSGLCRAREALPDTVSATAAFTNFAHDALHALAADPRLDRSLAASVLETMATVEEDIRSASDEATLARDMDALQVSADAALRAIDEGVPACD